MKDSIKRIIIITIFLIVIFSICFIGVVTYLLSNFDIKIVWIVSVFSITIVGICITCIRLISNNVNNTLESLSETIESIIDDNPMDTFSTIEDTMLSALKGKLILSLQII